MAERTTSMTKLTGKTIIAAHLRQDDTILELTLSGGKRVFIESSVGIDITFQNETRDDFPSLDESLVTKIPDYKRKTG